ncbi:MAG TPA: peptidylprolyl isomerase [Acidobacteriota bacterium]|nr:peptidylprolyl isomerase [Acidobacteriota bacterium]
MKYLSWGILVVAVLLIFACSSSPSDTTMQRPRVGKTAPSVPEDSPDDVALLTTDKGRIVIRFFQQDAPKTVANFKRLARSAFYNRTTFHRVAPGTLIQGGDPLSKDNNPWNDGAGNSGEFIPFERNNHKHVRGAVAMARGEALDSASCQFFIVLKRMPQWDGQYVVFGEVIDGLDVADQISRVRTYQEDRRYKEFPTTKQTIKSIEIVKKDTLQKG